SVFRTFFERAKGGRFSVEEQDDLCKLLVRITVRKTLRQVAFHRAGKRDVQVERGQGADKNIDLLNLVDRQPNPDEPVIFLDELEHLLAQLGPMDRKILEMRLQGHSNDEISSRLGIYDRKIRRVFERIRALAEQEGLHEMGLDS